MSDFEERMRANIVAMNALEGFDVTIVCCSSQKQANYWQKRLEDGKGSILPPKALVIAVQEDWPGGAGNGKYLASIVILSDSFIMTSLGHSLCIPKRGSDWKRKVLYRSGERA
jgi:hypothetical protein